MESYQSTANTTSITQGNIQDEQQEQIQINMYQAHLNQIKSRVYSSKIYTKFIPGTSKLLPKEICKIELETKKGSETSSGFILSFPIDLELINCLITNDQTINNETINNNKIMNIIYEKNKFANIKLDKNKRYIRNFKDIKIDVTVVEILNGDNISKEYFLQPELDIPINNELINKEIYIPQYIEEKKLKNVKNVKYAKGIIKDKILSEFSHSANTKKCLSGSPIFLKNSNKVIGIYKEGTVFKKINYCNFIYPIINIIKEDIRKKRNNGKYLNGRYIYDDDKYYIGEFKDNIPNGKGIKYYKYGNILYDGNFNNGIFEGNGKYIWENGEYYVGQFKNGLRHGKGTEYYSNGKTMYEGDYVNNKLEGNGKYIWEKGDYYIGQFKNGLKHGKGTLYYSTGNILYEGDWVNNKPEGNGIYNLEKGEYYIGKFKNGLRHGKGTEYYSNGNVLYEGDWVNGKREGDGKYIWRSGEYYIGQWKNGLRHGKGTMHYSDGNMMYDGDFIKDEREGNGIYIWENDEYYTGQWKNGSEYGNGILFYSNGNIQCEFW